MGFRNIAKLVRSKRVIQGISQTELSNKMGYKNGQFISNVERGLCSIPLSKVKHLTSEIGADRDEIINAMTQDLKDKINNYYGKDDDSLNATTRVF